MFQNRNKLKKVLLLKYTFNNYMTLDLIDEFFNSDINRLVSATINDRVLSNLHMDTSSKNMNTYIKCGIFDDARSNSKDMHRFSIVETVWINLIETLKGFNFSTESLLKIKQQLLVQDKNRLNKYPYFEFFLINAWLYNSQLFIVIDEQYNTTIINASDYATLVQSQAIRMHIVISISHLLKSLISKINTSKWDFSKLFKFTEKELELLAFIKTNDFDTIEVTLRNGELYLLKGKERVTTEKRIVDILREYDYQKIEVQKENHKIVAITRTVKQKL